MERLARRQASVDADTDLDLYLYTPFKPLPILFAVLFFLSLVVHVVVAVRPRVTATIALILGLLVEVLSQACRAINAFGKGPPVQWWLAEQVLAALAIPLFAATLASILARSIDTPALRRVLLALESSSFVVQTVGLVLSIVSGLGRGGELAIVAGSAIQLASFVVFAAAAVYTKSVCLLAAVTLIALRSSVRLAEYYTDGPLRSHEVFYYTLQALPVLLASILALPLVPYRPAVHARRRSSLTSTHPISFAKFDAPIFEKFTQPEPDVEPEPEVAEEITFHHAPSVSTEEPADWTQDDHERLCVDSESVYSTIRSTPPKSVAKPALRYKPTLRRGPSTPDSHWL